MTRGEASRVLGIALAPCREAPRLACAIAFEGRRAFHVSIRFDRRGRVEGTSAVPVTLTYSRPQQ